MAEETKKSTTAKKSTATKSTAKSTTKKAVVKKEAVVKEEPVVKEEVKEEKVEMVKVVEEKKEEKMNNNADKDNKTMTGLTLESEIILVYLVSILGFIFSFMDTKKCSERAKFAYNQSGALFLVVTGLSILSVIPFIGLLFMLVNFVVFIFTIIAIVKGYQGEDYKIPVISDLAKTIWKN